MIWFGFVWFRWQEHPSCHLRVSRVFCGHTFWWALDKGGRLETMQEVEESAGGMCWKISGGSASVRTGVLKSAQKIEAALQNRFKTRGFFQKFYCLDNSVSQ